MFIQNKDHAKAATKSIFDFFKANPKTKLSLFREEFANKFGFKTFNDFLNQIDNNKNEKNKEESVNITLLDLLQLDCIIKVKEGDYGIIEFKDSEFIISYKTKNEKSNYNCKAFIQYSDISNSEIDGNKIKLIDEDGQYLDVEVYLPVGSPKYNIKSISDTITVSVVNNSDEVVDCVSYLNNEIGKKLAKKTFISYMESNISNADEYSSQDIEDAWSDGCENFGGGKIVVTYDLKDSNYKKPVTKNVIQLSFEIDNGSAYQKVEILDDSYTEEMIIDGLKSGKLVTSTWHGDITPEITYVNTDHVVGRIISQEIEAEYSNYR